MATTGGAHGGLAAAGWYPEPAGTSGTDRYWDGTAWTTELRPTPDQVHLSYPPPTVPPAPAYPPPTPYPPPQYAPPSYPQPPTAGRPGPGPGPAGWATPRYPPPGAPGPQPTGAGPGVYGQPVVAAKNPAVSLIVSFFLPGVGSMINGDTGTGIGILMVWVVGLVLTLFIVGIFIAFGAWVWGLVDAYKGAQRWNARHGIIS